MAGTVRTVTTVTTNKTQANLMNLDFQKALAAQIAASQKSMVGQLMDDIYGRDGVEKLGNVQRRVDRVTTRRRTVSYPKGYWAKIEVNDTDHVTYKVFNSGWLAKTFNKIGFRKVLGNGWDSVKQRDTVEATLGATYMAIDQAIEDDLRQAKHSKFLKDMIKTDPDNLKAIAQLDMLDKGDGPGTESSEYLTVTGSVTVPLPGQTYSHNINVSGTGVYSKVDPSKVSSLVIGPISPYSPGGGGSITFGKEDDISVDPEGKVSFGDEMAKAIKEAAQEKGEVDGI